MSTTAWHRAKAQLKASLPTLGGQCLLCRQWAPARLCAPCLEQQARRAGQWPACGRCALPLAGLPGPCCAACLREAPALDRCIAALDYHHPWDRLLLDFKFNDRPQLARPLAALMLEALQTLPRPDLLCCVALSGAGLSRRGYNQSHELARRVAGPLGLAYEPRLLVRLPGPPQSRLDAQARRRNARGAFVLAPGAAQRVRGARIAVLDDVMTTGATLNEIAGVLKRAGAREVWGWVLMRAR